MADVSVDSAEYELRWPRDLFAREFRSLSSVPGRGRDAMVVRLLEEAFDGDLPVREFQEFPTNAAPWERPDRNYVGKMLAVVPRLHERHRPRPLFSARQGRERPARPRSMEQLRSSVGKLLREFHATGYFARELPPVDWDKHGGPNGPNHVLRDRFGFDEVWPLADEECGDDQLFDLVEAFHDLAARPRARQFSDTGRSGWRFSDFSVDVGRALYRWRINEILENTGLGLRMSDAIEDIGRLVHVVDEGRTDLVDRVLSRREGITGDRIRHAVAQFRGRGAEGEDKRQAVIALAAVLEERKRLLKASLFSDDESALFHIANKFDLRHSNDKQHTDYDPAFRDWVFWWYLATIELTDRILDRQAAATTA